MVQIKDNLIFACIFSMKRTSKVFKPETPDNNASLAFLVNDNVICKNEFMQDGFILGLWWFPLYHSIVLSLDILTPLPLIPPVLCCLAAAASW